MRRLLNQQPGRFSALSLSALPFLLIVIVYLIASDLRLAENPNDKLLPSLGSLKEAIVQAAFEPNRRTGEIQLWSDTAASLQRLLLAVAISALLGLIFGIATGVIPYFNAGLSPLIAVLSMIPPLAILPILFILFGLGELSKIMLIVLGVAPCIMRELHLRVIDIPHEQIIKAQTLGASTWQVIWRSGVAANPAPFAQRGAFNLGLGLAVPDRRRGHRRRKRARLPDLLLRRYLAMDTILPYVAWITLLAFLSDYLLRVLSRRLFPWAAKT